MAPALTMEVQEREWTLRTPWRTAVGTWGTRRGLVLQLRDGTAAGSGEASPLPGYSPDTIDDARRDLVHAARRLDRLDLDAPETLHEAFVEMGSPAARFALETAFYDLVAQRKGVPIWALLRRAETPAHVSISGVLTSDGERLVDAARALVARGIHVGKRKVGLLPLDLELAQLRAVHDAVGAELRLRLDPNRAWGIDEARARLIGFASLNVEFVEEPTADADWCTLRGVVPLALDESLHGTSDAEGEALLLRHFDAGTCQVVVLKPTVLGGFARCLALARLAAAHGARVTVTHSLEGPIAIRAAAHLALALDPGPLACGLDAAELRADDDALVRDGALVVPQAPGLGRP